MDDKYYCVKGERRYVKDDHPSVVDAKMSKEEAERSLDSLRTEYPSWKFWIEEDDVSQSFCTKPELSF